MAVRLYCDVCKELITQQEEWATYRGDRDIYSQAGEAEFSLRIRVMTTEGTTVRASHLCSDDCLRKVLVAAVGARQPSRA